MRGKPTAPPGFIPRYSGLERAVHWTLALGFILATLSGLALFHEFFWWMSALLGGGVTSKNIHPWAGLLMCVAFLPMAIWYWRDNTLKDYDYAFLKKLYSAFFEHGKGVPEADKYNAGQKLLFWTIVFTLIGLLATGIVLWFDNEWVMPTWLIQLSGVIHWVCAFALFLGIFVHIYMATLMIKGSMRAMVRGYVKPHWAYHHHPRWYRRVTGRQSPPGH